MTKRIKLFLVSAMVCLMAVSAVFLTLNVRTTKANEQPLTGSKAQAEVTAEVELSTFAVTDSASIRTESPKGIRFLTSISKEEVAKLPNNAVFGTLMIPTELLDGAELTIDTQKAANAQVKVYGENGDNYEYLTALVGNKNNDGDFEDFSSDFYTKEITARSYVTYTYGEGTTFTDYSNAVSWSVAQTAGNLLAKKYGELQAEQITYLKGVVDATKVDAYNEENTPVILTQNIVDGAFDVDLPFDAEGVIGVYGDNYSAYSVVDSDTIKITLENSAITGKVSFTVITERKAYALTVDINVLESMKATLTGNYIAQFDSEHYEDMVTVPNSGYYFEGGMETEIIDEFQGESGVLKISGKINNVNGQIIAGIRMPKEFTTSYTVKFYVVGKDWTKYDGDGNVVKQEYTAPDLLGFCNADGSYVSGGHFYNSAELAPDTWHTKTITPTEAGDTIYFMAGWANSFELEAYIAFVYNGTAADMAMEEINSGLKSYEVANFSTAGYENLAVQYSHNSVPSAPTATYLETYEGKSGVLQVKAPVHSSWTTAFDLVLPKDVSGKKIAVTFRFDSAALFKFESPDVKETYLTADLTSKKNLWLTYELDYTDITVDKLSVYMLCSPSTASIVNVYLDSIIIVDETRTELAKTLDAGEIVDFDSNAYVDLLKFPTTAEKATSWTAEVLSSVTLGGETRENVLKLVMVTTSTWSFVEFSMPKAYTSGSFTIDYFVDSGLYTSGQIGIKDTTNNLLDNVTPVKDAWTKKAFTSATTDGIICIGWVNQPSGATMTIYIDAIYDGTVA